jgi:hypothetical protein
MERSGGVSSYPRVEVEFLLAFMCVWAWDRGLLILVPILWVVSRLVVYFCIWFDLLRMPLGMASSLDRCEQTCPMIGEVVEVGIWCEQQKEGSYGGATRFSYEISGYEKCQTILTTSIIKNYWEILSAINVNNFLQLFLFFLHV